MIALLLSTWKFQSMNGEVLRWIKNRYDYVKNYWRDSFPSLYFHFCKNYDIVGLRRLEWNLWATSIMYLIWWNMLKISVSRFILKKAILFIYSLLKWTSNFRFTWHSQKALFSIFIFEKNQRCIQSKFFRVLDILSVNAMYHLDTNSQKRKCEVISM